MKEALVKKAADFSGRPQNLLLSHAAEGKGVSFVDNGPAWKEHRRFAIMTLKKFGMGKQSMEDRILGETEHLVKRLEKSAGGFLNPQTLFHDAASNIIYLVLFGIRYDYGDETLKHTLNSGKGERSHPSFSPTRLQIMPRTSGLSDSLHTCLQRHADSKRTKSTFLANRSNRQSLASLHSRPEQHSKFVQSVTSLYSFSVQI
ncbi:hypothetical protein SRHO_G00117980 [Serrasalmus rhombeus]